MRFQTRAMALWLGIGILFATVQPTAAQTPDTRPGIAVMSFDGGGSVGPNREDLTSWGIGLQQQMITELSYNPALRLVERGRLREVLDELGLSRAGHVDPQTAAQVGRMLGARYMILPSFTDSFGTLWMGARVVDVETGEIFPRAQQVRGRRENVFDLVVELSALVTRSVRLPAMAANVQRERKGRAIPAEAVTLYSKALALQDDGETEEAIELYRMISQKFPQMTEAREALRQLTDTTE